MSYPGLQDDSLLLDNLAVELQLNDHQTVSILSMRDSVAATRCGGCGANMVNTATDDQGRTVKDFACGHRYLIGRSTILIERVTV